MEPRIWIAASNMVGGYKHMYLVFDPDGDPESGDELVFRGGPDNGGLSIVSDGNIEIENWVPIASSKDTPYNDGGPNDDVFEDRNYTPLDLDGQTAEEVKDKISEWSRDVTDEDTASGDRVVTEIKYTYPLDAFTADGKPQVALPALNSNATVASALEHAGINVMDNPPRNGDPSSQNHGSPFSINELAGIETYYSGSDATIVRNVDHNQILHSVGGDTTYELYSNRSGNGTILILEDTDPSTTDKVIIKNEYPDDMRIVRDWSGNVLIYFDNDAPGEPSVIIKNQWDEGGVPRMNTIWIEDPDGNMTVIPLNNKATIPLETLPTILPQWIQDAISGFEIAEAEGSPLVLDLDGDGIELASMSGLGAVYWDIDLDNFAEASGWIAGGDGLLAIDLNADGAISDHSELFGTLDTDGFTILSNYDTNQDGQITSLDTSWSDLLVWVDANSDGKSESNELQSLDDWGISSIDVNAVLVDYEIAGNTISHESSFTINGIERAIVDAWFAYDNVNTVYADGYVLDVRTLFLPTLRGFGEIADLHIAMSSDEVLLDIVQDLTNFDLLTALHADSGYKEKVIEMMFRWAGVDSVESDSRGPFVDARKLEFMEKLFGEQFFQLGQFEDPFIVATQRIDTAFDELVIDYASSVFAQIGGAELYVNEDGSSAHKYSLIAGEVENAGDVYLTSSNNDLLQGTDLDDLAFLYGGNDQFWGNSGNDRVLAGEGTDQIHGGDGQDILEGEAGSDYIHGDSGNDTLVGGAGNDQLYGGAGDDAYIFKKGFGSDTLLEQLGEGEDTIYLHGIDVEDVHMWTYINATFLEVESTGDKLNIYSTNGQFSTDVASRVERIVFDDGTAWQLADGLILNDNDEGHAFNAADTDDVIHGNGGNDSIHGRGGDDNISGGVGNDQLYGDDGNDMIIGGSGDDYLNGGDGNDTFYYVVGDGSDTILGGDGHDTLLVDTTQSHLDGAEFQLAYNTYLNSGSGVSITFPSADGGSYNVTSIESIVFTAVEFAPTVIDDVFNIMPDQVLTGNVLVDNGNGQDYDLNGDVLTVSAGSYTLLNGGQLVLSTNGDFTYVPSSGYEGIESFSYTVTDGKGHNVDGIITINLAANVNPTATNDSFVGLIDEVLSANVLSNDSDVDGDELSVVPITLITAEGGGVVLQEDGNFTYTPVSGFSGSDSFTYSINDGRGGVASATVDVELSNLTAITGTASNETLNGTADNELIVGLSGSDNLYGHGGFDTLDGGLGNDTMYGGLGNDTFVFSAGDGTDTISESLNEGLDVIQMGSGLTLSDLYLYTSSNGYLMIKNTQNTSDMITINASVLSDGASRAGEYVEKITFDDGSELDMSNGLYLNDTDATNYYLHGSQFDDTLRGNGGTDGLYGHAGNDTLVGGVSNDTLYGGLGNDTYTFTAGDGTDTISESLNEGLDVIQMGSGLTLSDLYLYTSSNGYLMIKNTQNTSDMITINASVLSDGASRAGEYVEKITFDDGSELDLTNGLYLNDTDAANYYLHGSEFNDAILGNGGTDGLYGHSGSDYLNGGLGNDTMYGGLGNDTFIFIAGDGTDTVAEILNEGVDVIHMGGGLTLSDLYLYTSSNGYLMIKNTQNTSDMITINASTLSDSASRVGEYVEKITFDDGSELDLTNGLYLNDTDAAGYYLHGSEFNDTIRGNGGNDSLYGHMGNDTFVFDVGDGTDTITELLNEGVDVIHMGGGLTLSDLHIYTSSNGYLMIKNTQNTSDMITINASVLSDGASRAGEYVEKITFDDGSELDMSNGLYLNDTDATNYYLHGSQFDDTLRGNGGTDGLYGHAGNDTLVGGVSNDTLYGGLGNDTYTFTAGDGTDTISESLNEGLDVIQMGSGLTLSDLYLYTSNNGYLMIKNTQNTSDMITINASTLSDSASRAGEYVEKIVFDNGSELDLTNGLYLNDTDAANYYLHGSEFNDTIRGNGGTDYLYGHAGDDTLIGGDGNDFLYGHAGSDTFLFEAISAFSSPDTIDDFSLAENDRIDVSDLLIGYDSSQSAINDFVSMTTSGSNTVVSVDRDGSGSSYSMQQIATISGVTNLVTDDLLLNGNLLAA